VSPKSRIKKTVCLCNHLTSFSGGFVVQPNTLDWSFIFANADIAKNPTLYSTVIIIGLLYLLALIWARWKDKKDFEKLGVTPLPDNDPNDKYLYEIIVSTGLRKNAGTKSKVHVIFSGDFEETDPRTLEDDKRAVLMRGGVDSFLMAVPRPLGALNYLRVWHDNSGKGKYASWYVNWILVRDIQTLEKFHFIVNQWFAVE
ncbi:hypothetical protein HELRODRAFT_124863, partial [Helobdella robusta]|uniref:PLAT domain-containing protein n=1 Tax=Helobdella robusta TaxID=6412 RepID=T1EH33_HELRO